jgi:acetylornithine/N-succinyldiaminopimelate aminotransferase
VRALVPAAQLVDALRGEHVLSVAAGDNVVRLLPPLIVGAPEIAEGIERLDRAATRVEENLAASEKAEATS